MSSPEQLTPVFIERTGQRGLAAGSGRGQMELRFMPTHTDVRVNDRLLTSGIDRVYPAGIPVARVTRVSRSQSSPYLRVEGVPLAGLDRSRAVLVLLAEPRRSFKRHRRCQPTGQAAMSPTQSSGSWRRILGSLTVALLLEQLPWSGWALALRPDFLLVGVLFWTLHQPARIGFGSAFLVGLLADFQNGGVFGQHAMAYVVGVYLVLFLRLRLLQFDPLRQATQLFPIFSAVQLAGCC